MRLGRERSVEGLETILQARNVDLLRAYERGLRATSMSLPNRPAPLPPGIEALMVKHYHDPVMGGPLRTLCAANGTRYQTRALFDLFFAEWRSRKVRPSTYPMYDSALQTEIPGIEAPLLDWVLATDAPQGEDRRRVVGFLGRRRHVPAVKPFAALLRKGDPDAVTLAHALVEIGGAEAIDAAIDQVEALRRVPPRDNADAWKYLAQRIAGLPASVPIPYKRFRAVLPEGERSFSLAWLSARKDLDAVPDALALMGEANGYPRALDALVASDSPEVWKRARGEVERLKNDGRLNAGQHQYASRLLDDKIADPEKHFAEKAERERTRQFVERHGAMQRARNEARSLLPGEPERYLAAMHGILKDEEKFVAEFAGVPPATHAREQIGAEYLAAGHITRFRLKRPREALADYAEAERLGVKLGGLAIADTRQFDLADKAGAIAQYRKLLAEIAAQPAPPDEHGALARWMVRWLQAQVRFLETGATFTGAIAREEAGAGAMMAMSGALGREDVFGLRPLYEKAGDVFSGERGRNVDRGQVTRVLQGLPASSFALMNSAWLVGLMPDANAILAFLARQDPAGFATASMFGVVEHAQRGTERGGYRPLAPGLAANPKDPSPLATAKDRFLRERRIRIEQ